MNLTFLPKDHPDARIGKLEREVSQLGSSDVLRIVDVRDKDGNPYPDALVGKRDLIPLPDGSVAWSASAQLAELLPSGDIDLASLGLHAYVRLVKGYSVPQEEGWLLTSGFVSEVLAVPSTPIDGKPDVGDLIVHGQRNTYWVDGKYAFVALARNLADGPWYSYYAKAEML